MEIIKNNKKAIATGIAFLAGGLAAVGYIVPQPIILFLYSVLGLN